MSAVRRSDRRATRNQLSSPYKRPNVQPKKSPWSLSGLFSFLNPLRRSKPSEDPEGEPLEEDTEYEEKQSTDGSEFGTSRPADVLSQRGHELAQQQQHHQPQSPSTPTRQPQNVAPTLPTSGLIPEPAGPISPFKTPTAFESPRLSVSSHSPAEKLEAVKQYLRDRVDQPLHHVEYVGLVSLLKDSVQDDDSQPFRFSASPTPSRGTTPAFNVGSPTSNHQTPRRTLTRNPNGIYKWQGAGSARPRNRHQSPAFGPPRPTPSKIKLSVPESSPNKTDIKRRRVDPVIESAAPHGTSESLPSAPPREQPRVESSTLSTSSGSSSSHTSMNDSSPNKSTAVPTTPRLRLSVPPKPTTPAVPSPLRNTWGMGDSSSPPYSSPASKPSQPTRAANFMAELIKEVTPPKKPDLSNPYQTASPVKPSLQKKPVRKRKVPEERPNEIEKDVNLSPQTIIEATVPTGSKRSRPPPNIGKVSSSNKANGISHQELPRRSSRLKSPSPPHTNGIHTVINELADEEQTGGDIPSSKRQKKVSVPTVEEIPDVDMHSPTSSPISMQPSGVLDAQESQLNSKKVISATNSNLFGAASKPSFPLKSSAPKEPSKLRFGFAAETDSDSLPSANSADTTTPAPEQPHEPFTSSFTPKSELPQATPSRSIPVMPNLAVASSVEELAPNTEPQSAKSVPQDPKQAALALSSASLPSFSFNVQTGARLPTKHAKEREIALATELPSLPTFSFAFGVKSSAPVGFNWEAAGLKLPTKAAGSWTCDVCMVNNDVTKVKCVSCEEPRPDSPVKNTTPSAVPELPKSVTPSGGFNWAAAGLKEPTKTPGTWTCKVCMVDNDATKNKCISCEEPRA
ncbi:hypothetical protein B0F90DRAFT_933444 [Multifurca ochricompacta]|uniref:Nuclear pore complex protein Nup153 n=1 Tax=Multifurca ochricompacta TaxID=376703 RepID=A0AAD4QR92_9AGAM|nr:hypothetical protein B0F90DRAFT_933444 [Multifurca ochricompacta]